MLGYNGGMDTNEQLSSVYSLVTESGKLIVQHLMKFHSINLDGVKLQIVQVNRKSTSSRLKSRL